MDSEDFPGVVFSSSKTWQEQRRFALRTLRDFGFGKQGMEELIKEEVQMFKSLIDHENGKPFDIGGKLNLPILNALWKLTVGERFEYDDPKLLDICFRLTETLRILVEPRQHLAENYPWLPKIFPKFFSQDYAVKVLHEIVDMIEENITKHKETFDRNEARDFIDMALREIQKTEDPRSSFHGKVGLDNLKVRGEYFIFKSPLEHRLFNRNLAI